MNNKFTLNSKKLFLITALAAVIPASFLFSAYNKANRSVTGINKVNHVVVIYMENHSFDNLYGQFEGADGLTQATALNTTQLDRKGDPYTYLPAIPGTSAFPSNLPNNVFNIDQYIPSDHETPDVLHAYYQEQLQINDGKMNKFVAYNTTAGFTMGYYKTSLLPLAAIAKKYTLAIISSIVLLEALF